MTTARDEVLQRIRTALGTGERGRPVPRTYRQAESNDGNLELFVDRLVEYRAKVVQTDSLTLSDVVAARLRQTGSCSVLVPTGLPECWLSHVPLGVRRVHDDATLGAHDLDQLDTVLTGCALAMAETGTIVLDHGPGQGRRALTVVPDHHVVVVLASQVVRGVVEAVATLIAQRPMTWISGPSATSDIELIRVEGVHGPRRLDVLVVVDA